MYRVTFRRIPVLLKITCPVHMYPNFECDKLKFHELIHTTKPSRTLEKYCEVPWKLVTVSVVVCLSSGTCHNGVANSNVKYSWKPWATECSCCNQTRVKIEYLEIWTVHITCENVTFQDLGNDRNSAGVVGGGVQMCLYERDF